MNFHKCLSFKRTNTIKQMREREKYWELQLIQWCPWFPPGVLTRNEQHYPLLLKMPQKKVQKPLTILTCLLSSVANIVNKIIPLHTCIFQKHNYSHYKEIMSLYNFKIYSPCERNSNKLGLIRVFSLVSVAYHSFKK